MDLRRLEIFAKVADLGSFSRAAEALYLTQPTVSEHVRALEDELGVQLLDRLGGSTIPGEYVLPALLGGFKAKYPDISVSLLIGDSRQVSEWLEQGRVEVAVIGA